MVAKSVRWALAGLAACPTAALALGLGDIHLLSTLDAPLNAEIELIGATPDELSSLKPQIASREMFAQHGLDWTEALSNVTLRAVHTPDGRDVIKLQSSEPITEPFVTLLVEVDWDRGRLVHEYDVLLDPPVYTPNQGSQVAAAPVAAPVSGSDVHQGSIERPASPASQAETPATSAASAPAPAESAAKAAPESTSSPDSYDVQRGDTLSRIAQRFAGSGRADQRRWMVAAYQANLSAFQHNMNVLHAGAVLRVPSASAVDAVTASEASAEVHRQYVAWRGAAQPAAAGTEPGHLRLVAPSEASAPAATGAEAAGGTGTGNKALESQVQDLQSQLSDAHRRLDVQNAELAQLRAQLAARQSGAVAGNEASSAPPQESAASQSASAAAAASSASQAALASASQSSAAQAQPLQSSSAAPAPIVAPGPAAHHKTPVHSVRVRRTTPEGSWLDSLLGLWWVLLLGLVAVAGYFGFRTWTARRKAGFDDSLGRLAEAGAGRPREPSFEETEPQVAARESNFLVEESGTHERPRIAGGGAAAPRRVEADETISAETAINLDQGDPLAEADFHMAYGLYDQAADLVRIAIQRDPARRDLKLKLLEVFFVWGNKEQFLQTARELAETREQAAPGEWEKIVIMGKQLAPEDPLFASSGAVSGAAAGGVDLDLEGGQHRVDFDLLGEPIANTSEGVDLDIGTAIGERDPKAEGAAHQATDKNLALDDSVVLSEDTTAEREVITPTRQMTARIDTGLGSTREMTMRTREMTQTTRELTANTRELGATREMTQATREMTATLERGESWQSKSNGAEVPTVEQPALQTQPTPNIRRKVEQALRQGSSEHTTEVAIDDLGLELDALESDPQSATGSHDRTELVSTPDSPTLVANLDDHARRSMESSKDGELKISESGTWHFDEDPFANNGQAASSETVHTQAAGLAAVKSSGTVDFEVGDAHAEHAHANGEAEGLDMDVGTATVPDAAYTKTQRLGADDLALPDLDPVTMSEVGTKLDLARAYMDMGDPEGARNILEEVLTEGSVAQKQEAERLIASLPG
ncbi:MAG TPA: FimV/HubP family polar landmark protein [Steroidobacteraceae bacterium]|nr:FimV/HubP family polar landmark protein [Steroidobacteraceae bacterium]